MLPFHMFRARQPFVTTPPLCEASAHSASLRYPFSDSCNSNPSTVNPLSPFAATLTDTPQSAENRTTLSPAFATLTHFVTTNPFVCPSYKKTPGVGHARLSRLPLFVHASHWPTHKRPATLFLSWSY